MEVQNMLRTAINTLSGGGGPEDAAYIINAVSQLTGQVHGELADFINATFLKLEPIMQPFSHLQKYK